MPATAKLILLAILAAAWAHDALADKKTVCTITVNSPDEKETFRRSLPQDEFQFVELVERGRPDWLASACTRGVRCDVLLISGHFDGGTEFYSDRQDAREFLPVEEMERASCSESCPGLFSQLKEVYLFGCNTLNAEAMRSASAEIGRSLVRAGHSQADADRLSRDLDERHGESNRDRMRHIFKDVPVIYGFSSKAPLGPTAAPMLNRYFQTASAGEIGSGRPSSKLLGLFTPSSMSVSAGLTDADPDAGFRRDVCHFSDDRLSSAQKVGFVHELLNRDMAEVRMFLDHIERYSASLNETERQAPSVQRALEEIARDEAARARYLEFARDADEPSVRARMIGLARSLGWLSPTGQREEIIRMIGEELAGNAVSSADVELVCALNKDHGLDHELDRLHVAPARAGSVAHSAMLACLGSAEAHARVLRALASANDDDVQIARIYLHHRPITDPAELRAVATEIAKMSGSDAQVHALDTLASYRLSDRESLETLTRLFPLAKSVNVQRAIAGILIRSDYQTIAGPELVRVLREHRLKSPEGQDVIDALIRRLAS
jgi:voltage-gated potassium channel Kch